MDLSKGFRLFWTRIDDYRGTTSRREFWLGVLGNALIMLALLTLLLVSIFCFAQPVNPFSKIMTVLFLLFCVAETVPSVALIIRRMHDIGRSGYYIFVLFIPVVGFFWYLYLVTRPSAKIPYRRG